MNDQTITGPRWTFILWIFIIAVNGITCAINGLVFVAILLGILAFAMALSLYAYD